MRNRIYRGPANTEPYAVTAMLTADALPGTIVRLTPTGFTVATDSTGNLHVLNARDYTGDTVETMRETGDTAEAFRTVSRTEFQARMSAGTYTLGQPLTVTAGGLLTSATAESVIFGFFDEPNRTVTANALADILTV